MRPWTEQVYGIPPEQVVGSSIKTKFEMRDGKPVLVRLPELNFNDDKADKPVGINQHIGRRPIAAFGNSGGDQQMLEYTQGGSGARFDAAGAARRCGARIRLRPGAADCRTSNWVRSRRRVYDEAQKEGWTVVSMKNDWKQVFPAEQSPVTAIDILLEPDATMLQHSAANNARLLKVFPKGFALDATHTSAHHDDPAFRPHGGPRQGLCRRRQGSRRRQCDRHEAGGLQILLRPGRRDWRRGHLSRSRRRKCSSCKRTSLPP